MNRFKLYLNDTNIEHQKECVKILFKHFNGTYRNTYNGNLEVIIEEKKHRLLEDLRKNFLVWMFLEQKRRK